MSGTPPQQGTADITLNGDLQDSWRPVVGDEANMVLETLGISDQDDKQGLLVDAVHILQRCVPPTSEPGTGTGLAVGHIQSGKTSSFTTVAALAHDNRYPIVIVIAGTKLPLFRQSRDRLYHDLRLSDRKDRAWMPIENPGSQDAPRMRGPLQDWRDGDRSQTVLLMVMKQHQRLARLTQLLRELQLDDVPVLIVDDEADQASLNNLAPRGQESTTYSRLLDMRALLPVHTFLQYTGTPQAPLLISLIDSLSPEFSKVLRPGKGYTGGATFFIERPELVRVIPQSDLPIPANNLMQPPDSLLEALRLYFVGVAAEYVRSGGSHPPGNRSMLIHPSMGVLPHNEFGGWVTAVQSIWSSLLIAGSGDPGFEELAQDMHVAYNDLLDTVPDLPSFDAILTYLYKAIDRTLVTVMNASQVQGTPDLHWNDRYSHILIGGEVLNRGFTVEGLTVTYMPRTIGSGNVDTVQQRARFFGYKSGYIGYCRVYLEAVVEQLFRSYIDHEESLRKELIGHGDAPLADWKRKFLLDIAYSPTRRSVLGLDIYQGDYADRWTSPDAPHRNPTAVASNREVVKAFRDSISSWAPDPGHQDRTDVQIHPMARVPALEALERLLAPLRFVDTVDSVEHTGVMLQLRTYLEDHPMQECVVYQMSGGRERHRGLTDRDEIENLYQGRNPPAPQPMIYPGDREIHVADEASIQIHMLQIDGSDLPVPTVAIWLPPKMSRGVLVAT